MAQQTQSIGRANLNSSPRTHDGRRKLPSSTLMLCACPHSPYTHTHTLFKMFKKPRRLHGGVGLDLPVPLPVLPPPVLLPDVSTQQFLSLGGVVSGTSLRVTAVTASAHTAWCPGPC